MQQIVMTVASGKFDYSKSSKLSNCFIYIRYDTDTGGCGKRRIMIVTANKAFKEIK